MKVFESIISIPYKTKENDFAVNLLRVFELGDQYEYFPRTLTINTKR